jgi:AraC-like DNA-binding protein
MVRVAGEYGVSAARCIAGTGLTDDDLVDPAREVAGEQELAVLRNILHALPVRVPFGFVAGQHYHSTTHGMLGFAMITSPDVRSGLDVMLRYFDLSMSFNRLGFEIEGRQGRLLYDDSDNPDDLRAALVERDVGALVALERDVLGRVLPAQSLTFRAPRPAYPDPLQALFGAAPRYDAAINCIGFDLALLDVRLPLADEHGRRVSEDQCRALMEQRGREAGLSGRVRSLIVRTPGEFPSMQTVAAELGMSARTLRNRLAREETSYRELIEHAREALAEQLLTAGMTMDAIAERLGYAETSSFVTAFKRWKGVPPHRYRQEVQHRP